MTNPRHFRQSRNRNEENRRISPIVRENLATMLGMGSGYVLSHNPVSTCSRQVKQKRTVWKSWEATFVETKFANTWQRRDSRELEDLPSCHRLAASLIEIVSGRTYFTLRRRSQVVTTIEACRVRSFPNWDYATTKAPCKIFQAVAKESIFLPRAYEISLTTKICRFVTCLTIGKLHYRTPTLPTAMFATTWLVCHDPFYGERIFKFNFNTSQINAKWY